MRSYYKLILITSLLISKVNVYAQKFQPFKENHNRLVQGISLSANLDTLYFSLPHKERLKAMGKKFQASIPKLSLYKSYKSSNGNWSEPEQIKISGKFKDYEPTLSPDGKMILFNSNRPLFNSYTEAKNNIWFSRLKAGEWQEPMSLRNINTSEFEESYPTISSNNKLIYTKEVIKDGKIEFHLFETFFNGEDTLEGEQIIFPFFDKEASDPHISKNGDYLVFAGFHISDWNSTCDLYISFFKNGAWSSPKALKELNSNGPDFSAYVSNDNSTIFYRKNFQFLSVPFKFILTDYY